MPRDNTALEEDLFAEIEAGASGVSWLSVDQIEEPTQARKYFDAQEHKNLVASIKAVGMQQPIQVRRDKNNSGQYLLISGARRLRATRELGQKKIKATVVKASDYESIVLNLVENIQRAALRTGEESIGIAEYVRQIGGPEHMAAQHAAITLGKPLRYIKDRLRIAAAPEEVLKAADSRPETASSVLIVLRLQERNHIRKAAALIQSGASKRQVEEYVDELLAIEQSRAETRARLAAAIEQTAWTTQSQEPEVAKLATQGVGFNSGGTSRTEASEPAAEAEPIATLWQSEPQPADTASGYDYAEQQNATARENATAEAEILRAAAEADRARAIGQDRHARAQGIDTVPPQPRAATDAAWEAVLALVATETDRERGMMELGRIWREWAA